jgi:hypothetical protein
MVTLYTQGPNEFKRLIYANTLAGFICRWN